VRRQRVGVVQHRGDRQVLAAHRAVDDDLQALDRGEDVDRAPVAACAIVIEDEHQIISSALRLLHALMTWRLGELLAELGAVAACLPRRRRVAGADAAEEVLHLVEAGLVADGGVDHLASEPAPAGPISGRAEIRLVK
jgi:hypothetical protein